MKPKILVLLNRLVVGGQALDTIPLLVNLQDEFDLLVLYGCREGDEVEAAYLFDNAANIAKHKIAYFRRRVNMWYDFLAFLYVIRAVKKFKPNIVHTHGLKSGIFGRIAAYIAGTKCIIHTYHGHHFHSYFGKFVSNCIVLCERCLAGITTKIIAISNEQQKELVEKYNIARPAKVKVIPLGIDEKMLRRNDAAGRQSFRYSYALNNSSIAIGIIGRIVPVKNYALFVNVAAKVIAGIDPLKKIIFFVIGDGHDKSNVQAALNSQGISWCGKDNFNSEASVIFTSWIKDVSPAVNAMDIVISTSHNEGTPLSLIEAQFCGKPVVATNVGGVKDTFINGQSGILVQPGNAEEFARAVMLLINNDGLRSSMGNKAALFAEKNFSKIIEVNSYRQLYSNCAK